MSTSLMPLDPAMSPQQVARLLPIRANLLPAEITSRRNARRMRTFVIAGVILALVGLGGWSVNAYHDHSVAEDDLAAVNAQIAQVNSTMNDAKHSKVTKTIAENKAISDELKTLMASDLRWSTFLDNLRSTGTASNVTIGRISAALSDTTPGAGTAAAAGGTTPVATLNLEGNAPDKSTIAGFIKKLQVMPGIGSPYLTSATQLTGAAGKASGYTFTISADVTSAALCGRFTTACKSGGK
jgi:hypothetical protein